MDKMDNQQQNEPRVICYLTIDPSTGEQVLTPMDQAIPPAKVAKNNSRKRKTTPPSNSSQERTVTSYHKWTTEEETKILGYMVKTIQDNKKIEKPTADAYYKNLIEKIFPKEFGEHVPSVTQLKNKVRNLKESYVTAKRWSENTGEGILSENGEAGRETVAKHIEKLCAHFTALDEIFGTAVSLQPLYVFESSKSHEPIVTPKTGNPNELGETENSSDEAAVPQEISSSEAGIVANATESQKNDNSQGNAEPGKDNQSTKVRKLSSPRIDKLKEKLTNPTLGGRSDHQKNGLMALTEVQKRRLEASEVKYKIEEKKIEITRESEDAKVKVEEKKLSFEMTKHEENTAIRKSEIASSEKLKILEIESQERIAKFKIELEMKYKYGKLAE